MNIQFIYNCYQRNDNIQYHGIVLFNSEYVKHLHLYNSNYNNMIESVRESICEYACSTMSAVKLWTIHDILLEYDTGWRGV